MSEKKEAFKRLQAKYGLNDSKVQSLWDFVHSAKKIARRKIPFEQQQKAIKNKLINMQAKEAWKDIQKKLDT